MKFSALLSFLMLTGCAITTQFTNKLPEDQPKAKIYLLRPSPVGTAVKVGVYQGGRAIGMLGPKNYLAFDVPIENGEVELVTRTENWAHLTIEAQTDSTYYVRQGFKPFGFFIGRSKLRLLDEAEGIEILAKILKSSPKVNGQAVVVE